MHLGRLDAPADAMIRMFHRPNPMVAAIIVEDLGLLNGTQQVLVRVRGAHRVAAYMPAIALEVPGNCWVERLSPAEDAPLVVALTNYQVPVRLGWGGGTESWVPSVDVGLTPGVGNDHEYDPEDPASVLGPGDVVVVGEFGWGVTPWGS